MLSGLNVTQTARGFIAAVDDFKTRRMRRAAAMALNKTGDGVRVDSSREIRARFKIRVAVVNKAFSISRASADRLVCTVRVRGRPLNLGNFSPRQTRRGVTVQVKGARKLIPHAFIVQRGGAQVVFIREGNPRPGRLPIKPLTSVDLPGVFSLKEVQQIVTAQARDRFEKELSVAIRAVQLLQGV
jgi:hypothetical protein